MKQTDISISATHNSGYAAMCALSKKSKGRKSLSVPVAALNSMIEAYEDMLDIVAFDTAKNADAEYFPKELVDRLIAGDNALKTYREYRKFTQQTLAKASGVSRDMIAMIETGRKTGSLATIKKLATALKIDIEVLAG